MLPASLPPPSPRPTHPLNPLLTTSAATREPVKPVAPNKTIWYSLSVMLEGSEEGGREGRARHAEAAVCAGGQRPPSTQGRPVPLCGRAVAAYSRGRSNTVCSCCGAQGSPGAG